MPIPITGNPANFHAAIHVPAGGEARNAESVRLPFQEIADNLAHHDQVIQDGGLTREGATRNREVADEAALKALTGMEDGELAITKDKGLLFRYHAAVGGADVPRWVIKPAIGPGAWVNTSFGLLADGPFGLVSTDHEERIPAAMPRNGVVALKTMPQATIPAPTTAPDYSPGSFAELALGDLEVGDVVDLTGAVIVGLHQAPHTAIASVELLRAGAPVSFGTSDPIVPAWCDLQAAAGFSGRLTGRLYVKDAGAHSLAITARRTGGDAWGIGVRCAATVYRP